MDKKARLRRKCDRLWYEKLITCTTAQDAITEEPVPCGVKECEVCGEPATQIHHFYYKGSYGHLRYDLDNGIALCRGCHFKLHHRDPKPIEDAIIKKRGKKWAAKLKKKAYTKPKPSYQTIKYYNDIINQLQG